ncbi:MAG: hypothetical protein R3C20_00205 [Planctomycetaceae bacterium]
MLTVTDSAWNRLATIQTKHPQISDFRLTYADGKVKCRKGVRRDKDKVIEAPGRPSLFLSSTVANELNQRTLDAVKVKHGPRLRLK